MAISFVLTRSNLSDSAIISPKSDQLITREPNQIQLTKLPSQIFHSWDPSFFYNKKPTHPVGKKSPPKKKKRPKVLLPDFHQIALDRPPELEPEMDLRVWELGVFQSYQNLPSLMWGFFVQ